MKAIEPTIFLFEPRVDYLNLYCLNLMVYANAKFVIFNRYEDLLAEVKAKSPDTVFVSMANQEKVSEKLLKLNLVMKDKFVKPLCIVQAKTNEKFPELNLYEEDLSAKEVVSSVAKKMGITAKYMAELDVGEYFLIPVKYILPGWQVIQPFYKKEGDGKFSVFLNKDAYFTQELVETLKAENTELFCKSSYRLEIINSFTNNIKSLLDSSSLSVEDRFKQTNVAFNMISESVSSIGLPETTMQLARSSISSMEKLVAKQNGLGSLYDALLKDGSSKRFKHALISSFIGQFVLKDQSWNNSHITSQWSYLCFFHDIVLTKDSYLDFNFDDEVKKSKTLNAKEKNLILTHAQMSAKLISQVKDIPVGIDTLIKQHHGSKMGNSLSEISLSVSPMCTIFMLVENYVHFLLSGNEKKKSAEEIHDFIETLFKKYPYPNFKKLIPLLRTIPLN